MKRWFSQDYGDQILKLVLATRPVRGKLHTVVLMALTFFVRFVVSLVVRSLVVLPYRWLQITFSIVFAVTLVLLSDTLYGLIAKYRDELFPLTEYICNHWDEVHLKRWKRNGMLVASVLIIAYASVVEITSAKVIQWTLEYVACYFLVEGIHKRHHIRNTMRERRWWWRRRPRVTRLTPHNDVLIDESYTNLGTTATTEHDIATPPPPPTQTKLSPETLLPTRRRRLAHHVANRPVRMMLQHEIVEDYP